MIISFDVDGTLECGTPPGPIPLAVLIRLMVDGHRLGLTGGHKRVPQDIQVSWRGPQKGRHGPYLWSKVVGIDERAEVKAQVLREQSTSDDVAIHVGDEATDYLAAVKAGWEFLTPQQFLDLKDWWSPK